MPPGSHRRSSGRAWAAARVAAGTSLAELLLALTLTLLVSVAALAAWSQSRRALRALDCQLETQQSLRVALDLLLRDLTRAGLGVDPDGSPRRVDEGLEGLWPWAVVVRADRDRETAAAAVPETALTSGAPFPSVTTGNDEIVAWVLAGAGETRTLWFHADVAGPRDGRVEPVRIDRVVAEPGARAADLVRVSLDDSGRPVRVPVVRGVKRLLLHYRDRFGEEIAAVGGGEDAASRRRRASVRRIEVELVGAACPGAADRPYRLAGAAGVGNLGRRPLPMP